MENNVT